MPAFDDHVLAGLRLKLGAARLDRLLLLFEDDLAGGARAMRSAIADRDAHAVRAEAYRLHVAANSLGASVLGAAVRDIFQHPLDAAPTRHFLDELGLARDAIVATRARLARSAAGTA